VPGFVELRSKSNGDWTEATGCATEGAICTYAPVPNRCGVPQVLPAYGLQDSRNEHRNPKTKASPNTMCPQITPGEDHGSGHFYLAKTRTFLLCVDIAASGIRQLFTPWPGVCGICGIVEPLNLKIFVSFIGVWCSGYPQYPHPTSADLFFDHRSSILIFAQSYEL
jgi:hypothetical protein